MYYINIDVAANLVSITDEELGGHWSCEGKFNTLEEAEAHLEKLQDSMWELLVLFNAPTNEWDVVETTLGDGPDSQFKPFTVIGSADSYEEVRQIIGEYEANHRLRWLDVNEEQYDKLFDGIVNYCTQEDNYMFSWHVSSKDVPPQDQISELPDRDWFHSAEGLEWINTYV